VPIVTRASAIAVTSAVTSAVTLAALLCNGIAPAFADPSDGVAVNGRYTAFSDGAWAKTNDRFHDEASTTSTWTITSSCSTFYDCTGRVVSDAGWSGDLLYLSGRWRVSHEIPDWQRCPDGSTAPGTQAFTFAPPRADDVVVPKLVGLDSTTGPSGACGVNLWNNITMPFTLTRLP
jgi:hypothetical protein